MNAWTDGTRRPVTRWTNSTDGEPEPEEDYWCDNWYVEIPVEKPPILRYEAQFPVGQRERVVVIAGVFVLRPKFLLKRDAGWRYRLRTKPCGRKYLAHNAS
jgi:hypothetical protein